MTPTYVVVGSRPWSRRAFDESISALPGRWTFVGERSGLRLDELRAVDPRYVFFLHWSWIVPEDILQAYECVGFHMTDLPYGRGGSPLQNLILRGKEETSLTGFRMTEEMDAGPVYLKRGLSLEGSAEEIYLRMSFLASEMIGQIIQEEPGPTPQEGEVVTFKRRRPEQSQVPDLASLRRLYDFIRMLDAEGYPKAFVEQGGFRYELSDATLGEEGLEAVVKVTPIHKEDEA